jgi:SAM-dependent methyltransferase
MDPYIHGSNRKEQNRLSRLNEILNAKCLRHINIEKGMKILDVGSGLGQMVNKLGEMTGPNGVVLGIERDQNQLASARKLSSDSLPIKFRKGNAYDLPLESSEWGSFDLIHCRFVLEHLNRPEDAVAQMYLAAKRAGKIILFDDDHQNFRITPTCEGFDTLWKVYYKTYEKLGNDPFIGRKLVGLLKSTGCKNIKNGQVFFGSCADEPQFTLYAENLIEVVALAKDTILSFNLLSEEEFEQCISDMIQWSQKPDAAIWYQVCFAQGTK